MRLAAVTLAAGKGTRMKSDLPKVLHRVCGRTMVEHVLGAVTKAGVQKSVLVVGHHGELVAAYAGDRVEIATQHEQLGTAHALLQTKSILHSFDGDILVLCGDTPLLRPDTLEALAIQHHQQRNHVTVLTTILPDPSGYGRIIRGAGGRLQRIVEQKDGTPDELAILEINTGVYCFNSEGLYAGLAALKSNNAQGEYYLTDIIEYFAGQGKQIGAMILDDPAEVMGINDRCQLAAVEKIMRHRTRERLMMSGVTMMDPDSTFIDDTVEIGPDTIIYPNTIIEGKSKIGENCLIGPSTRLIDVSIGCRVIVQNSVVTQSKIADECNIGPFAYIRPGCELGRGVKVGDFVELKNSRLSEGSKVPHLSYVGDAEVGPQANIGAGTITCNYDGEHKHVTRIGAQAFIGSNTNLVAPVEVGAGAVTGAGSTITKDIPPGSLGVARGKQQNIPNWADKRKKLSAQKNSE